MTDVLLDTAATHDADGTNHDAASWGDGSATKPHEVVLAPAPRSGGRQAYDAYFRGELLLVSQSPEFDACRLLQADGYSGHLQTRRAGAAKAAMRMTIEAGALLTVSDAATGVRIVKWRPFQNSTADNTADG